MYHAFHTLPHFQGRRVLLKGRPSIPYDVLSINVGITPSASKVPGADLYTTSVKPIDRCGRNVRILPVLVPPMIFSQMNIP